MHRRPLLAIALLLSLALVACGKKEAGPARTLTIVAGSESRQIEPIIQEFAKSEDFAVRMTYSGSVEMMLDLQAENFPYDAVLPANSMWIRLGDAERHRVTDEASIMRSPVVLGVKRSKAEALGWVGREVRVADILQAVRAGDLQFAMTSATQSNSGASAYMGLLYALAGGPTVLTSEHLAEPGLRNRVQTLLAGVDRGSGSSGWLKDLYLRKSKDLDAMFNYEAMIIAASRELEDSGREPLYVIYPADGLAIADSTLGFVKRPDNAEKREFFQKLRDHLLTPDVQEEILETGFRTGLIGMNPEKADKNVFNPDWGIDLTRIISPIPWPPADVIHECLTLYQTVFRKPSFTVYLLDISGSMEGEGIQQLKAAMTAIMDQEQARQFFLQASGRDVTAVIPFFDKVGAGWQVQGNRPEDMAKLMGFVNNLRAGGGTNIYLPVMSALDLFQKQGDSLSEYLPAVLLMTDGQSQDGNLFDLQRHWREMNANFDLPPIFAITFGDADERQLRELTEYSDGRVFDGKKDGLEQAFRKVKGYN